MSANLLNFKSNDSLEIYPENGFLHKEAVAKLAADETTRFLRPVARGGVASPLRADGGLTGRAGE
jgi:hypothetical protein